MGRHDVLAKRVYRQIVNLTDLDTAHAVYYRTCYFSFMKNPARRKLKVGRPISVTVTEAMDQIFHYVENSEECQFSANTLMNEIQG